MKNQASSMITGIIYWVGVSYTLGVAATVTFSGIETKQWLYALAFPAVVTALFIARPSLVRKN
ncbi:hypothetical protein JS84_21995 [Vibrio vulnificus]|nr:hypothetical protein [Vibrio vulnificus]KFK58475.1 hypothetical protein JS83_18545 [Vibrio vulnificus]KFK62416.1 hypothetical protein JS84_21995 [Vibrio vulnificus]KFK68229.1 hypothetical protein JS85_15545 [Vibrio vulnificus]NHE86617.1 hypothetical protein [Vibrio vulnificus]POC44738.1 hypothetical protein CRN45_20870 [Vibrio vulnificus]